MTQPKLSAAERAKKIYDRIFAADATRPDWGKNESYRDYVIRVCTKEISDAG